MEAGRYTLRNLMNAKVFDYKTDKYLFRIDYGTAATNEWTAEQTPVRGGDGFPIRVVYNDSKNSTLNLQTQIFSMQQLAMLNGSDLTKGAQNVYKHEILTVLEDTTEIPSVFYVNLAKTPVDWNGDGVVDENDIIAVKYVNGVQGDPVTVSAVTTTTVGGVTTTKVELEGVTKGEEIETVYKWSTDSTAISMNIYSDKFPGYVKIVGDSLYMDEVTGEYVAGQTIFYKAKVQPNYTMNYNPTGDATQLDMMFDILTKEVAGKPLMSTVTLYEDK